LQYLLPENQESWERSGLIVAFMRIGLAELGLAYQDAVGTAVECARTARCDAIAAARFATARFLSGQYGLHAGFVLLRQAAMPPRAVEDRADVGCD
jgi:hypothetical protein